MWTGRSLPKSWAISTAFRSMIIGHTRRSLVTTSMEFRSDRSRHFGPCLQSPHKVFRGRAMSRSFALALGGGGARALAHVAVLEALDELNEKPVAVAGSSMGALLGAAYAAGMSGKDIRRFILALVHDRAEVFRRLIAARAGKFASLLNVGFDVTLLDAEKFCGQFLPSEIPDRFDALAVPLVIMASDLHRREPVAFASGALKPALAASIAVPTVMRPVVIEDRVLIDGGATNPVPFDQLRGRADVVVAVDLSGGPTDSRRDIPVHGTVCSRHSPSW